MLSQFFFLTIVIQYSFKVKFKLKFQNEFVHQIPLNTSTYGDMKRYLEVDNFKLIKMTSECCVYMCNSHNVSTFKVPIQLIKSEWGKVLETCFVRRASSENVFEDTFEFLKTYNYKLKFSSVDHKSKVMTDICTYYITTRMKQYTYMINQENKKTIELRRESQN